MDTEGLATLHAGHLTAVCIRADRKLSLGIFHSGKRTAPQKHTYESPGQEPSNRRKRVSPPFEAPTSANPRKRGPGLETCKDSRGKHTPQYTPHAPRKHPGKGSVAVSGGRGRGPGWPPALSPGGVPYLSLRVRQACSWEKGRSLRPHHLQLAHHLQLGAARHRARDCISEI